MPSESSTRSDLARIAPFTLKAMARRCVIGVEATEEEIERTALGRSFPMECEEAVIDKGDYDLELCTSKVNQTELNSLRARLHIPSAITMRAPTQDELPFNTVEDRNKIPFLITAFECGVRFLLAPFIR